MKVIDRVFNGSVTSAARELVILRRMTTHSQEGLSRRSMLGRSAVGIALSGSLTGLFGSGTAPAGAKDRAGRAPHGEGGYGPLVDDPAGLLSLPAGFSYTVIAHSGVTRLESGEPTPSDPDGRRASCATAATAAC